MDTLQDFFTFAATVVEYFFFAYLAVAFIVHSLKSPHTTNQSIAASASQPTWKRSANSSASLAVMAG